MRALGIENDQEVFTAISGPQETFKFIVANINEVNDNEEFEVKSEPEAYEWLQKKFAAGQQKEYREARVNQLLDRELYLTWVISLRTERRRLSSSAVSFAKSLRWLSTTRNRTTRTTTQTSEFVLLGPH